MARLPFSRPRSTLHRPRASVGTNQNCFGLQRLRCCSSNQKQRATGESRDSVASEAAIALAQQQEAKFWELRATATLAKLRADQGRPSEAHDLLAPVYGCFTEGIDTLDLRQAKVLLDRLHA